MLLPGPGRRLGRGEGYGTLVGRGSAHRVLGVEAVLAAELHHAAHVTEVRDHRVAGVLGPRPEGVVGGSQADAPDAVAVAAGVPHQEAVLALLEDGGAGNVALLPGAGRAQVHNGVRRMLGPRTQGRGRRRHAAAVGESGHSLRRGPQRAVPRLPVVVEVVGEVVLEHVGALDDCPVPGVAAAGREQGVRPRNVDERAGQCLSHERIRIHRFVLLPAIFRFQAGASLPVWACGSVGVWGCGGVWVHKMRTVSPRSQL